MRRVGGAYALRTADPRQKRLPRKSARDNDALRRASHLRRGHHGLPPRHKLRLGLLRRHARPLDLRQDNRRRPARRRLRRTARRHELRRPDRPRLSGWDALRQPHCDGGGADRAQNSARQPEYIQRPQLPSRLARRGARCYVRRERGSLLCSPRRASAPSCRA